MYIDDQDDLAAYEEMYARDQYENRCYDVNCDACKAQARASEMLLKARGWTLTKDAVLCPADTVAEVGKYLAGGLAEVIA